MKLTVDLSTVESELAGRLAPYVPDRVIDLHAHLFRNGDFDDAGRLPYADRDAVFGRRAYRSAVGRWLPAAELSSLFFGFPVRGSDLASINEWVADEVAGGGSDHALALAAPDADQEQVAAQLRDRGFVGIKPYHVFGPGAPGERAGRADEPRIEEFAPEWMWELCAERRGVLMLHLMRDGLADEHNLTDLLHLARRHPSCQIVLAHAARSFNHRTLAPNIARLADVDNVFLDTSAVANAASLTTVLRELGPRRLCFGSDFPIGNLRGQSFPVGRHDFAWQYATDGAAPDLALIGIESLQALLDAADQAGLDEQGVIDVFHDNAARILKVPEASVLPQPSGRDLWFSAKERVSNGTGLVSKWAERYDVQSWPVYYSRAKGASVWDTNGHRYLDFHGGQGAVLLGYADPDVDRAVHQRIDAGSISSLISPQEYELADELLRLNPWAGKVRFARGGGEAMAVAVRVARGATGRSGVAFCGYHGWHDWYLAANLGDTAQLDGHLLPGLQPIGVPRELQGTSVAFRYNDIASFDSAIASLHQGVAAVVMEPMRSEQPDPGFLEHIERTCRDRGIVLVIDEITSGWRYGFPGAVPQLGMTPDVVVYAKAMSNGYPCAAVVGRSAVLDGAGGSFISSTSWTDGIGPAAGLASVRKLERESVSTYVAELGEELRRLLAGLVDAHPSLELKLTGQPSSLNLGFALGDLGVAARQLLIRGMVARGFLVSGLFYLTRAHDRAHLQQVCGALDEALLDISESHERGALAADAGDQPTVPGFARLV